MSTTIRPAAVMSARVPLPFDPGRPLLLTRTLRRGVAGHAQAQTAMWGPCASCVIPYIQGREGQGWQYRRPGRQMGGWRQPLWPLQAQSTHSLVR